MAIFFNTIQVHLNNLFFHFYGIRTTDDLKYGSISSSTFIYGFFLPLDSI